MMHRLIKCLLKKSPRNKILSNIFLITLVFIQIVDYSRCDQSFLMKFHHNYLHYTNSTQLEHLIEKKYLIKLFYLKKRGRIEERKDTGSQQDRTLKDNTIVHQQNQQVKVENYLENTTKILQSYSQKTSQVDDEQILIWIDREKNCSIRYLLLKDQQNIQRYQQNPSISTIYKQSYSISIILSQDTIFGETSQLINNKKDSQKQLEIAQLTKHLNCSLDKVQIFEQNNIFFSCLNSLIMKSYLIEIRFSQIQQLKEVLRSSKNQVLVSTNTIITEVNQRSYNFSSKLISYKQFNETSCTLKIKSAAITLEQNENNNHTILERCQIQLIDAKLNIFYSDDQKVLFNLDIFTKKNYPYKGGYILQQIYKIQRVVALVDDSNFGQVLICEQDGTSSVILLNGQLQIIQSYQQALELISDRSVICELFKELIQSQNNLVQIYDIKRKHLHEIQAISFLNFLLEQEQAIDFMILIKVQQLNDAEIKSKQINNFNQTFNTPNLPQDQSSYMQLNHLNSKEDQQNQTKPEQRQQSNILNLSQNLISQLNQNETQINSLSNLNNQSQNLISKDECHYSCLTCQGSGIEQCLSCNSDTRVFVQKKYCMCQDGYMEVGEDDCQQIDISGIKHIILKYVTLLLNFTFLILVSINRLPNIYFALINLSSIVSYDIYSQPLSNSFGKNIYLDILNLDNFTELIPPFIKQNYLFKFQEKYSILINNPKDMAIRLTANKVSQYLVINALPLFLLIAALCIILISLRKIDRSQLKGVQWNLFLVFHFLTFQDQLFYIFVFFKYLNQSIEMNVQLASISCILTIQLITINFIIFFYVISRLRNPQNTCKSSFNMIFLFRDTQFWPIYLLNLTLKAMNAINAAYVENKYAQVNLLVAIIVIKACTDIFFLFKKYYFQLRKSYLLALQLIGIIIYLFTIIPMINYKDFYTLNQEQFSNKSIFLKYQNILFQTALIFKILIGLVELLTSIINYKFLLFIYYHQKRQSFLVNQNDSPINLPLNNSNQQQQQQQSQFQQPQEDSDQNAQSLNQITLLEFQQSSLKSPNRSPIRRPQKSNVDIIPLNINQSTIKIYKLQKK